MELASLFTAMLKPLLWLAPLLILGAVLASPWFKGLLGEYAVRRLIARRLDPSVYREFSDVTIPGRDGTTQIDHIYVSPFGVFVIETKNMKGWIFGSRNQPQWKQVIYHHRSEFQNPIRQNYGHIKSLQSLLDLPSSAFKSVIVFTGDCTFKTEMPDEVCTCSELIEYIHSIDNPILSEAQIAEACGRIRNMRLERSWRTHRDHVRNLRHRHPATAHAGPVAEPLTPIRQRSEPLIGAMPPLAPGRRLSRAIDAGRDRDWGALIFGAALLLVLMVSCVRWVAGRGDTVKTPVRREMPARAEPAMRPPPVASSRSRVPPSASLEVRTEAPQPREQTPEEAREARRKADAAMEVIKATTPEM